MKKKRLKKSLQTTFMTVLVIGLLLGLGIIVRVHANQLLQSQENRYYYTLRKYEDRDFGYQTVLAHSDTNKNGIDDVMDLVFAARQVARSHPKYVNAYYGDGYPPDGEGISTDLLWRALKGCGIDFKALIDEDIIFSPKDYNIDPTKADPNIDFRRIANIIAYLRDNADTETLELTDPSQWQAGDIVIFASNHLGILSNYRNEEGYPYVIHHTSNKQEHLEEDVLISLNKSSPITGHYRWSFD